MSRLISVVVPLAVLCLFAYSGTNAGSPSPRRSDLVVAGLIPPPVLKSLEAASGLPVTSAAYAGSLGIMEDLRRGSVDFGAATADASYLAFTGALGNKVPPFPDLRGVLVLDLKTIHLVVPKGSRIGSIADLRGLDVSLGPPGTGTSIVAELLLNIHGLRLEDVTEEYLTAHEAVVRIKANTIDAVFLPMVAPAADATSAAAAGARFLEIAGPKVEQLRLQHPFLLRTRLSPGTYPGLTRPIQTIGVDLLLVCRSDAEEELVYTVLKTYFDERAKSTIATDLNRASAMSIPLHAGAARYYRERELSR
jgi:TRAP transporter TAXI family solute receptor